MLLHRQLPFEFMMTTCIDRQRNEFVRNSLYTNSMYQKDSTGEIKSQLFGDEAVDHEVDYVSQND